MSETQELEQLLADQDGDSDLVRKLRKVIRDQKQTVKEATETAQKVQRESVFNGLGLDPTKGMTKLFYETYQGDLSADAVKEAAEGYGLLSQVQTQETAEQEGKALSEEQQDQQSFRQIESALGGATPGDGTVDQVQRGQQVFSDVYSKTGNSEEAMAALFADRLASATGQRSN